MSRLRSRSSAGALRTGSAAGLLAFVVFFGEAFFVWVAFRATGFFGVAALRPGAVFLAGAFRADVLRAFGRAPAFLPPVFFLTTFLLPLFRADAFRRAAEVVRAFARDFADLREAFALRAAPLAAEVFFFRAGFDFAMITLPECSCRVARKCRIILGLSPFKRYQSNGSRRREQPVRPSVRPTGRSEGRVRGPVPNAASRRNQANADPSWRWVGRRADRPRRVCPPSGPLR